MNNILVPNENISEQTVIINDSDTLHHIIDVLRIKKGKEITVSDGGGFQYRCQIDHISSDKITALILEKKENETELQNIKISLFQGVTKGQKMEMIIQKAVELGVVNIYPVYMDRSISIDNGKGSKKNERWQKIADETLKQCKGCVLPKVHTAIKMKDCLQILQREDLVIFPYEASDNYSIRNLISDFRENNSEISGCDTKSNREAAACDKERKNSSCSHSAKNISIIIGPEGGFSEKEAENLKSLGIRPVTLGKRILRTETAAVASIAMTVYAFEL